MVIFLAIVLSHFIKLDEARFSVLELCINFLKCKVITDLKTPLTKDVVNHNCGFLMVGGESAVFSEEKEASLDMSKDVMLPGEMTFRREALTASTPAAALR